MAKTVLKDLDPAITNIFDALLAFMGDTYPTCNAYANFDGQGTNLGINCTDVTGQRFTYSQFVPGVRIVITPQPVSLGPGETQQFAAQVFNPDGTPVAGAALVWSVVPGGLGTISATGLYTAPATITAASADTIRCQESGGAAWVTFAVSLHP
jgi:hypothetical protein